VVFLFPDYLHQHPLAAHPVELAVKDLLPWTEIQFPIRHRHHHLPPHHLALEVRVGVVLTGAVVPVLIDGRMRRESFQPDLIVVVEAALVKMDQIYTKLT